MTERDEDRLDRMRLALRECRFPPYAAAKRFARQVGDMPRDKVSPGQWLTVIVLAYRFQRQMPHDLIPAQSDVHKAKKVLAEAAERKAALRDERRQAREAKRLAKQGVPAEAPLLDFASAS